MLPPTRSPGIGTERSKFWVTVNASRSKRHGEAE
jgi:hypothetical protein